MTTVDGYLSKKMQLVYPGALVLKITRSLEPVEMKPGHVVPVDTEDWVLRRKDEPDVCLGHSYGRALQAVQAIRAAEAKESSLLKLAKACLDYDDAIKKCANDPAKMSSFCTAQGDSLDALYLRWLHLAKAAAGKRGG